MSFPDFRMRRLGLAAAAAIAAVAFVGTAAAQSMVVRSTGPSASKYPAGAKLKSTDKLTLVAGDRIILMQAGKTRTLSGPGTFGATGTVQASQSLGGNVTRMLAKGPTMRSRGGFSRGDTPEAGEVRAPNLWLLDYREAGTFCVLDPSVLMLWRPNMEGDTALEIESAGKKTTVAIVDGANFRKWPTDVLPVRYGADYRLSGGGLAKPVTVRFAAVENAPDTVEGSIDMLMAKGCSPQLNRLVDTMSDAEAG
ncbi:MULTISPECIES: hypothetical protein [unclassified Sphingopyxis]|jgi:hypothetical protein|uniref:hypothetical protein n=1 Tax=unclassified Sphingopyxis TaxID=2614943 RepID=UPI0006C4A8E6|nr:MULTISPECIES: hypothetical protein [unclassified Sphingopyxis]USI77853.1 hypothetical protein KEC45_02840 [Sphingopyxis sp. USTB-05]GAO79784.1 hypothetical protein SC1_03105 [Sphingopyxis sp. C-1]